MNVLESMQEPGLYVVSDTYVCDGTGPLLQLVKNHSGKTLFISTKTHSHYKALFKKYSINTTFLELDLTYGNCDLPLIENPPDTWSEPPHSASIESLWKKVQKLGSEWNLIVLDDFYTVSVAKGKLWAYKLLNSFREVSNSVIVKTSSAPELLEDMCDNYLELRELATGYSAEYTGKLLIKKKNLFLKEEVGPFWFLIKDNQFKVIE